MQDGHRVILREISYNHLERTAAMTVAPSIDPSRFLEEHLARAGPDLLRQMLQTFINTLLFADADAVCGAPYGSRQRRAGEPL